MGDLLYSESVIVARPAEFVYDMVSDVTRMGEWSPICTACWWDDGDGPRVGAWFTGRNEVPGRAWETRSQVVVADRGQEFAFVVGGAWVRWGYAFTPVDEGTQVTESWEFLPSGIARFHERYGEDAQAQITERTGAARSSIPATLAAIKKTAESDLSGWLNGQPGRRPSVARSLAGYRKHRLQSGDRRVGSCPGGHRIGVGPVEFTEGDAVEGDLGVVRRCLKFARGFLQQWPAAFGLWSGHPRFPSSVNAPGSIRLAGQ
jgi:hypothetical protein